MTTENTTTRKSSKTKTAAQKPAQRPAASTAKGKPAAALKEAQEAAQRAVLPAVRLAAEHRLFIDTATAGRSKAVAALKAKNKAAGPLDVEVRIGVTPDEANALLDLMRKMANDADDVRPAVSPRPRCGSSRT